MANERSDKAHKYRMKIESEIIMAYKAVNKIKWIILCVFLKSS